MTWSIRKARTEESTAIAALVNSAYRGESSRAGWTTEADLLGGQRTDPEAIVALIASQTHVLLIAEDAAGHLSGCVLLERRPDCAVYLGMLTVDPRTQARGLGKQLLEQGEALAREQWSASTIEMTVITRRSELIAWYERRGYARTGETRPFPAEDPRFVIIRVAGLEFEVLRKTIADVE